MNLQNNLPLLKELRLCLKAGNEVWLMRKPKLPVYEVKKSYEDSRALAGGTVIRVLTDSGWITCLSGEKLRTSGTYGREWTV
jgi:hypothetical protein